MIHLGDITKIEQAPFVDCITFGSPCQDLSMAGKREGLKGERSGLFMQAVRIIKEMRIRSGGVCPTFAVWENVPGAFSSNGGEDFRTVLEELARITEADACIPRPEKGKWPKAGYIAGDHFSIAWRTFDAQYWGVPQRRNRIALVVDFGGQRAGEILFERTSLRGDTEPSVQAWKGIARNPADGSAGHDRVVEGQTAGGNQVTACLYAAYGTKWNGNGGAYSGDNFVMEPKALFSLQGNMIDRDVKQNGSGFAEGETMYSLTYTDRNGVAIPINTQIATRHISLGERTGMGCGEDGDPAYTLQSGHEHAVCCLLNDQGGQSIHVEDGRVSPTLRAESHAHEPVVVYDARGNGDGEICPCITGDHENRVTDYTAVVAFSKEAYNTGKNARCSLGIFTDGTAPTVRADTHPGGVAYKTGINGDVAGTLDASYYKGTGARSGMEREVAFIRTGLRWIVRRLTPTECERLQGFPDGWTDIGEWHDSTTGQGYWTDTKGKRHKTADSPRYKALGNSIALPQWWWITCKMARYLPEKATLGSLFDGIGGFPLVWETRHGKGTAVWASEIEEFPIAVTKMRFKEE